jgi:hypothetical protein
MLAFMLGYPCIVLLMWDATRVGALALFMPRNQELTQQQKWAGSAPDALADAVVQHLMS